MAQQTLNYGSAINDGTGDPLRTAFSKCQSNFTELYTLVEHDGLTFVSSLADLPAAAAGVITLASGCYVFTKAIDLLGARLNCTGTVCIMGTSSETASITSTGLGSNPIISTTFSLPMRHISIIASGTSTAISAVAASADYAIDWQAVNFVNTASIGTISGYSNVVGSDCALLGAGGLTFGGTIGTVAFSNCLFNVSSGTGLSFPTGLTISRRIRITNSSFVVATGATGINVSTSASVPTDGYILDTVNFSGAGTYTAGVTNSDNKARFTSCKGITNSVTLGYKTMINNATATTISAANTPVKLAGTFTLGSSSQRFSLVSNQLVYNGALTLVCEISVNASLVTTANNEVAIYIYKNNVQIAESVAGATATGSGKAENISSHAIVTLTTGDVIDVWTENQTAGNNITGENAVVIIKPVLAG
jgi:hypothetical protein